MEDEDKVEYSPLLQKKMHCANNKAFDQDEISLGEFKKDVLL